ncbi:MAG: hypothetical protein AAB788_04190 [Patescibacteria group bacterium]
MDNKDISRPIFYLISSLIGLAFFVLISLPIQAATADYQRCKIGSTCIIGEFLYDDNYNPIATASCVLTTRDPGGSVFINSASMSATTDGWYSYDVNTTSQTEGLYRSQMCCTTAPDYLCLDKSFYIGPSFLSASEVENSVWDASTSAHVTPATFGNNLQKPVLLAAEIWGYTDRTLSGFGTLISDIWSYSTRSLNGFGTLITDIWENDTRTLTSADLGDGEELATLETVEKTSYSVVDNATSQNGNKNAVDSLNFGRGTINFEITVTNPSPLISQRVPFIYYFPSEVKKEDIIKVDEKLITTSNNKQVLGVSTDNTALFVSGEVLLLPLAKKIYNVEIKDVWTLAKEEIESVRVQAKNLFEPLKNTSYFAQGATLKSDIDVNLDRAWLLQKNPLNPQEKIENYRRALAEFNLAKDKIDSLKTLVAQAGSAKSLFGFIGGIQVASVWGLILVFIAGFVFMILFMKSQEKKQPIHSSDKQIETITENRFFNFFHRHKIKVLVIALIFVTGILLGNLFSPDGKNKLAVAQRSIEKIKISLAPTPTFKLTVSPSPVVLGLSINNKIFAVVPSGSSVRIHSQPLLQSETVYMLKSTATVNKLQEMPDWIKIEIPEDKISSESAIVKESSSSGIVGWIAKEFTQEVPK